ncbi:CobW family GTP-binding protein [Kamptonema formosum]|uniref:CobW family GTP-binding protein n=1 Tax=Kamptonema formosum TaxID=331992 RepID=UPI000345A4A6|nr:GTP-binding protein [Oscillatoria sp. PCC 10802]
MVWSGNIWRTPVTLLTGFLGAGKTTLLNRILQGQHKSRFVVLVNDFGSLNIDRMLIKSEGSNVMTLEGGCVCCLLKNDLVNSILKILSLRPDRILIESSGVANPYTLLQNLKRPVLSKVVSLESIISLVDITSLHQICQAGKINYQDLLIDQISAADIVVINKMDLADETEKATAHQLLRKIAPWARLLEASYADVSVDLLLGFSDSFPTRSTSSNLERDHSAQFQTWSYQSDLPFNLHKLRKQLSELPAGVFRAKGILFTVDRPEERVIVQQVGPRITLEIGETWGEEPRFSQLVLIGVGGSLDTGMLQHYFDSCLMSGSDDISPLY